MFTCRDTPLRLRAQSRRTDPSTPLGRAVVPRVTLASVRRRIASITSWFGRSYPGRLIAAVGASQAGNYASAMAFTAFVSMFPLILGLLSLVGYATQSHGASAAALNAILGFFPSDAHDELAKLFVDIQKNRGTLGIVSVLGLVWSGSSLFTGMEFALGVVVGGRQRSFLRQRAMALVMTVLFVVALVVTIGVNSLIVLPGVIWGIEPVVGLVVWCALMLAQAVGSGRFLFLILTRRRCHPHAFRRRPDRPGVKIR